MWHINRYKNTDDVDHVTPEGQTCDPIRLESDISKIAGGAI